jgi:glycosyltransferase involved in cell wall biosynthesis
MAEHLELADRVIFLGTRDDVPQLLSASDVFALTSRNEANPVSILEAMSVGRAVVATDVGSIREAVTDGRTGFLVPTGDADRFSRRVIELLEDPLRCQAMGTAARCAVVAGWSVDAMVRRYERLIADTFSRKQLSLRSAFAGNDSKPDDCPETTLVAQ